MNKHRSEQKSLSDVEALISYELQRINLPQIHLTADYSETLINRQTTAVTLYLVRAYRQAKPGCITKC